MYNLRDTDGRNQFKERLSTTRKARKFTQEKFAEAVHDSDRSLVANWESYSLDKLPSLRDLPKICELLETDPNYLLGFSDDISSSDKVISDTIHISEKSIYTLRNNPPTAQFIDYLISSSELDCLLHNILNIGIYELESEPLKNLFSEKSYQQICNAFFLYRQETLLFDMNPETFSMYIKKFFPWKPAKQDFIEFVKSIVIDERYPQMILSDPRYTNQTNIERYDSLMIDIAQTSYPRLMKGTMIELTKQQVFQDSTKIISDYIDFFVGDLKKSFK